MEAAPAFIVGAALRGAFGDQLDLVLSGVNKGVNVPNVPLDELRGPQRAKLSSVGTVQATVTELGEGYLRLSYGPPDREFEPGSDAALITEGVALHSTGGAVRSRSGGHVVPRRRVTIRD